MEVPRFISTKYPQEIRYPVGRYIRYNLPIIKAMTEALKTINSQEFLCLWCMGSSGAIIAGIIASEIENAVIMYIKKEGETSHSGRVPYPPLGFVTNVIIDDFISTGETVNTIARMIIEQGIIINGVCISGPITLRDLSFQCEFVIAQEIKPNT